MSTAQIILNPQELDFLYKDSPCQYPSSVFHQSSQLSTSLRPLYSIQLPYNCHPFLSTMDKLSGLASKLGGGSSSSSKTDSNQAAGNEDYLDKGKPCFLNQLSLQCIIANSTQVSTAPSVSLAVARSTPRRCVRPTRRSPTVPVNSLRR